MKYISTRGSSREYTFTEAFLESYAEDGGLFCPKDIPHISTETMMEWKKLSFYDLSLRILSLFIDEDDVEFEDLELILRITYEKFHQEDLVTMKFVGPVKFAELFYGPTYHIKDFSMQFIGQFLKYLVQKDEDNDRCHIYAVVVGTDSDTGASLLAGTGFIDYRVNGFCIYPRNNIDYIQEREMISNISFNGHSLCMENSGIDSVLRMARDLVMSNRNNERMHIISANSCHIARVICEIPIFFYSYFHSDVFPNPIAVSLHVANLKSPYTACICRDMGLPVERLLLACQRGSVIETFLRTGDYQVQKHDSVSACSSVFVHSNLERMLFYMTGKSVAEEMNTISRGECLHMSMDLIHKAFPYVLIIPFTDKLTSSVINLLYHSRYEYLVCPHAATCFAIGIYYVYYIVKNGINPKSLDVDDFNNYEFPPLVDVFEFIMESENSLPGVLCLNSAHPGKFPYFVAEALNAPAGNIMPKDIQNLPLRNSRISVIPNDLTFIRNYISHICFDCVKQFYH